MRHGYILGQLVGAALVVWVSAVPIQTKAGSGDPVKGESIYERCMACHALAYDRTGPRHCGLFGRKAGSVAGFSYSEAMKNSGIVWTDEALSTFLADPLKTVPGTSMGYQLVNDPQDRADLIAYLKQANESTACRDLETGHN